MAAQGAGPWATIPLGLPQLCTPAEEGGHFRERLWVMVPTPMPSFSQQGRKESFQKGARNTDQERQGLAQPVWWQNLQDSGMVLADTFLCSKSPGIYELKEPGHRRRK